MQIRSTSRVLIVIAIIFFSSIIANSCNALGVSPAGSFNYGLYLNSKFEQIINVTRSKKDSSGEGIIKIELTGDGKEYIRLDTNNSIFKVGETVKKLPYTIDTKGAKVGDYKALISIYVEIKNINGGNNTRFGVEHVINFSVTDKIKEEIAIREFNLISYENNSDKISGEVVITNKGNVESYIDEIVLEFTNLDTKKSQKIYHYQIDKPKKMAPFSSYNKEKFSFDIDSFLPAANYEVTASILKNKTKKGEKIIKRYSTRGFMSKENESLFKKKWGLLMNYISGFKKICYNIIEFVL